MILIKPFLLCILFCLSLMSCYHDDVKSVEAKIDYPALDSQDEFDTLQQSPAATIDETAAQQILFDVMSRLMDVVEIGNQLAGEVSEGTSPSPLSATATSREFIIEDARSDACNISDNSSVNTQSLVRDDNGDNIPSRGDVWYYIWEGCNSVDFSSTITGVMSFSGMSANIRSEGQQNVVDDDVFSDYAYSFDLQVESSNNQSVFMQNVKFVFSRDLEGEDENEITQLKILPGSIMGVKSSGDIYVFNINSALLVSRENEKTLALSFDALYYDSADGVSGFLNVSTVENEELIFQYERSIKNPSDISKAIQLMSGNLQIEDVNKDVISLSVGADKTKVKIITGAETPVTLEQESFFNADTAKFSLVNLTG